MSTSSISDLAGFASRIVAALHTVDFPTSLNREMMLQADFDLTAILAYPMGQKPILLHDGLQQISPPDVMANYLNATYVLDACYVACTNAVADGLYRLSDLAPDNFFESGYYNSPDVHPCISLQSGSLAEEIMFIVQAAPEFYLCYSLMRSSNFERFDDVTFTKLKTLAPLVCSLLRKNWEQLAKRRDVIVPNPTNGGLETAFANFEKIALSPREQHIVSLMLRGHSSQSIGNLLEIAEGTVKNHRKHIYAKLGLSSQSELFARFVRHALGVIDNS